MIVGTEKEKRDFDKQLELVNAHPQVVVNDDGTKTVKLAEPVEYAKGMLSEVTFRKPKGRDWRSTDDETGDVGKGFAMAAALSDKPTRIFDDMEGDDAILCMMVANTMGKKPSTGGMSSAT